MFDRQYDAKSAVLTSAAILLEIMELYEKVGLAVAAAHLSTALDAACDEAGMDRSALALPPGRPPLTN